jgi:hypothetical protein
MEPQEDLLITEKPKPSKPSIGYLGQLGILLGLIGVFTIVASLIAVVVWMIMTGGGPFSMEKDMLNPANTNAARWVQLVAAFFMFFVPALIFAIIINKKPLQQLGFNNTISGKQFFILIFIALAAMGLSGALGTLNELIPIPANWAAKFKKAEDAYNQQVMIMAKMNNWKDYVFSLIVIALAPAIFEEVLFRGALQKLLQNWTKNHWAAIIITSFLFSAVHFSYYGFLARAGLGVVLGLIFYYSKNIWLNIIAHFLNNAIAVTALYALSREGKNADEALKDNFPLWYGLIALTLIVFFFINFKKESEHIGANEITDGEPKLQSDSNPFLQ